MTGIFRTEKSRYIARAGYMLWEFRLIYCFPHGLRSQHADVMGIRQALTAVVLLLSVTGCASKPGKTAAAAGRISGRVILVGTRPPEKEITLLRSDPHCQDCPGSPAPMTDTWIGEGDGLANVLVYVQRGAEGIHPTVAQPPVFVERCGCRYRPSVVGVEAGQPVEVRGSDNVLHNVNFQRSNNGNPTFNFAQAPRSPAVAKVFPHPEVFAQLICNVHPWESFWIGVTPNGFYAVTDAQGRFELPAGLPAGRYTLAAAHRRGGEVKQEMKLARGRSVPVKFQFQAP